MASQRSAHPRMDLVITFDDVAIQIIGLTFSHDIWTFQENILILKLLFKEIY